jgi:DNA polymerase I
MLQAMIGARFLHLTKQYIRAATVMHKGPRTIFDTEGDGLRDTATKFHCIVITDLDGDWTEEFGPGQIGDALDCLSKVRYLAGHNILGHDLPLLKRLHDWMPAPDCVVVDTLIASRLILPHLLDLDQQATKMGDQSLGSLMGRHSLEAWGKRLGFPKIGADIEVWAEWTQGIQDRCVNDTALNKRLWQFLQPDGQPAEALALEHHVSQICDEITDAGMPFDTAAGEHQRDRWTARLAELKAELGKEFPEVKNWNSRPQLAALLQRLGWTPDKFTNKTKAPVIDDEVLETLPELVSEKLAGLAEYSVLTRRLGQLAVGDKAWLRNVGPDGRIHGRIVHIGTPHSRAAHLDPNIAQIPNAKKSKQFAAECRALFRMPDNTDWVFVASDQAGLQDRAFSHYLAAFDGGMYAKAFLAGLDTHWATVIAHELVPPGTARNKTDKLHTALRESCKGYRYGFLFGMGGERAGIILRNTAKAATLVDPAAGAALMQKVFGATTPPSAATLKRVGKKSIDKFEAATPGLKRLRSSLKIQGTKRGWLPGLDGRRVPVRAQYTTLNFAVTSAEAIICKRWLVNVRDELGRRFRYGWDGDVVLVGWVHDELVACCRPEIADAVGEIMVRWAKEPAAHYDFKCALDAAYTISRSWAGDDAAPKSRNPEAKDEAPPPPVDSEPAVIEPATLESAAPAIAPEPIAAEPIAAETPIITAPAPIIGRDGFDEAPDSGGGHKIFCPYHDDKNTPNCHIYPDGHFHCFSCGAHGPTEELVEEFPDLDIDVAAAAGNGNPNPTRNIGFALRDWNTATPIEGTLAKRYLTETRHLDLDRLGLPGDGSHALRFHPHCRFGDDRVPCLLARYSDVATDTFAGIIRIGLTGEAKKIDRMTLGCWPASRAVKLWPATTGELAIGEGIETVLGAIGRSAAAPPAWALGPRGGIENFPLLDGVTALSILVDHDATTPDGTRACVRRWNGAQRYIRLLRTDLVKDFNDLR